MPILSVTKIITPITSFDFQLLSKPYVTFKPTPRNDAQLRLYAKIDETTSYGRGSQGGKQPRETRKRITENARKQRKKWLSQITLISQILQGHQK